MSSQATESPYPEHDKLSEVSERSQEIGAFLDFGLPKMGLVVCEVIEIDGEEQLIPMRRSIQSVLAEYFGIDQAKIDAEKEAMLEAMRAASATSE